MKASATNTDHTAGLIRQLEESLNGGSAHVSFDDAVRNVPHDLLGITPERLPYSIWQLAEHIRNFLISFIMFQINFEFCLRSFAVIYGQ
jgi:hypothetical protein